MTGKMKMEIWDMITDVYDMIHDKRQMDIDSWELWDEKKSSETWHMRTTTLDMMIVKWELRNDKWHMRTWDVKSEMRVPLWIPLATSYGSLWSIFTGHGGGRCAHVGWLVFVHFSPSRLFPDWPGARSNLERICGPSTKTKCSTMCLFYLYERATFPTLVNDVFLFTIPALRDHKVD